MNNKAINANVLRERMVERGLSAADIADELSVSRTIVSEWIRGRKVPRPRMLFEIGRLLGLKASDLIIHSDVAEPVVAFRKRSNCKPDQNVAVEMGYALEHLVDYLPFNKYQSPPGLISPKYSPEYIEKAAEGMRKTLNGNELVIEVKDLIARYGDLKIVPIPVLWGEKDVKYNALSIFLPESGTNWVFLNLDVKPMDFKFWILHEMIHSMVRGKFTDKVEEEKFCDDLSAAILVPREFAEKLLEETLAADETGTKFEPIFAAACSLVVSPITLTKRVDAVAKQKKIVPPFGADVFSVNTDCNKEFGLVSEKYFDSRLPSAEDLIRVSEREFDTPVYTALGAYLRASNASEGFVTASLGISPVDAKAVYRALVKE